MGSFSIFHWVILLAMAAGTLFVFFIVIKAFRSGSMPPAARPTPANARLDELADLRAKRFISEAEFERKRAEILRDL